MSVGFDHDYPALIRARRAALVSALGQARAGTSIDRVHRIQSALWELSVADDAVARLYAEDEQDVLWIAAGYGPRMET